LTLSAFLVSLANQLNRLNDAAVSPVTVRAVPLPPASNRKAYSGRVYCALRDPGGRDAVDASVGEDLVDSIPWHAQALVTGFVTVRVGPQGKFAVEFRIDSVRWEGVGRLTPRQELEQRWGASIERSKRNITRALIPDPAPGAAALNLIGARHNTA
jgi:hypothetical protein